MDKIIRYKEENIDSKESISKEIGKGENLEKKKIKLEIYNFPHMWVYINWNFNSYHLFY